MTPFDQNPMHVFLTTPRKKKPPERAKRAKVAVEGEKKSEILAHHLQRRSRPVGSPPLRPHWHSASTLPLTHTHTHAERTKNNEKKAKEKTPQELTKKKQTNNYRPKNKRFHTTFTLTWARVGFGQSRL